MRNRLVTLLLLLVFCGSLVAGPHPCDAQGTAPEPVKQAKAACHHTGPAESTDGQSTSSSEGEDDCCAGRHAAGCEHACHMVALVRVQALLFAVLPQARMVVPTFDRSLPLFASPIDHIPLA
jgi:hypothetical protein